jgi:predicted RecA/RadA family phage recombinase
MAQNYVQPGGYINAAADSPADPASGEAVRVGTIAGVAVTREAEGGNAAGECTIATEGVFNLPVIGNDGTLDADVEIGDKVYFADGVGLNKDSTGTFPFGKALGHVAAGATTVIPVMLIQA